MYKITAKVLSSRIKIDERTNTVNKQIKMSFIFKILSILLSYAIVPITLRYLGMEFYGIWLTLLSVVSWISFFDVGLGNGMKNRIGETLAKGQKDQVKIYISTTYLFISLVAVVLFLLTSAIIHFIDLEKFFNTTILKNEQLKVLLIVTLFFILLNFVLSLINQVFNAFQKSSLISIGQFIANLIAIIFTVIISLCTSKNIVLLAIIYGSSLVLSNLILSFHFFKNNSDFFPSIKYFKKDVINSIGNLGIKFFIIQIAALVLFSTDNLIITKVLGPEHVTSYNLVYKLFSIITIAQSVIFTPLWSAYTDAYVRQDFLWIKKTVKKFVVLMVPLVFIVLIMAMFTKPAIYLWVGKSVRVGNLLIISMALFSIISTWNNIFAFMLNGVGKINISLWLSILAAIVNIPLSIYMAHKLGESGVVIATILCLIPAAVLTPIQCSLIQNNKQFGNKLLNKIVNEKL